MENLKIHLDKKRNLEKLPYTDVIVDEAQGLMLLANSHEMNSIVKRLYELTQAHDGCFYELYDNHQSVIFDIAKKYAKDEKEGWLSQWIDNADCRLVLSRNCRNTQEIFDTSCSVIGLRGVSSNGVHGKKPAASLYAHAGELAEICDRFVAQALECGLQAKDIAILTAKTMQKTDLDLKRAYGGIELSPDEAKEGRILFTTVRKFKGLEASVVLITDVDLKSLKTSTGRSLLYVGASRARSLLNIAIHENADSKAVAEIISSMRYDAPSSRADGITGLKKLLKID